jgi:hypothetical protein
MKTLFSVQLLIIAVLLGCNGKRNVDIVVNGDYVRKNNVVIDDSIDLGKIASKDSFIVFTLKPGVHKLSVNKDKTENFRVGKFGGILNVDHQAYVIFPIKYEVEKNILSNSTFQVGLPILIDSTIIYQKILAKNQKDLLTVLKNPNIEDLTSNSHLKIEKDQLFINRFWDYGINEEIPETINVSAGMSVNYKRKIAYTYTFLAYAFLSDEYIIEKISEIELFDLLKKLNMKNPTIEQL